MAPITKDSVLKKLEIIFWHAFKDREWQVAVKIAELLGKNCGLFEKQPLPEVTRIADMTKEQLCDFMEALEKLDPSLKHPPPPVAVQRF